MTESGHEIIAGMIGTGKSYWLLYQLFESLRISLPFLYIDPKGDGYQAILSFFMCTELGQKLYRQNRDRIIFINPVSTSGYMTSFNALKPLSDFANAEVDKIALLANSLVSHIRRQSGFDLAEANRMQNIMTAGIATLVDGGKGAFTLAELPLLFTPHDKKAVDGSVIRINEFVQRLLPNVTHYGAKAFWYDQWSHWQPHIQMEWSQSSTGRIFGYTFDERFLMTVCSNTNSTLDFRKVVNEGYWVFANLPFAYLSEPVTTLLGNILITNTHLAAMQRPVGDTPFRIYLDEARFFQSGPLEQILETSRAYNLWLTLVVQNLDQMCRVSSGGIDYRLKETVTNLTRYMSIFQNSADAKELAELFFPVTGRELSGIRDNGDFDYLPIQAEINEHQRRFTRLQKRELIIYDRFSDELPKRWTTPTIDFEPLPMSKTAMFEAEHMHLTARPYNDIKEEVFGRQKKLRESFGISTPSPRPPTADVGGRI